MKALSVLLIISGMFLSGSSVVRDWQNSGPVTTELTGSTPCDSLMKNILSLPVKGAIDFMRWDLSLNDRDNTFILKINYGEAQPNTLGFKRNGSNLSISGDYEVTRLEKANLKGRVYILRALDKPGLSISMVKLNDNLFHLLTKENRLFVGDGGWSYTLNRKEKMPVRTDTLPVLAERSYVLSTAKARTVFDGRTPCMEIASEYILPTVPDCFKIKWRLTLMRNPETLLPSGYILENVFTRLEKATGTWSVAGGTPENPGAIIYRLHPDKPGMSFSFLAADENILYFLDKNDHLFTGNNNFSYTLNRVDRLSD